MFSRAAWTLGIALVIFFINRSEYPGPAARMCGVLALIGLAFLAVGATMVWFSRVAKLRLRDQLLDSLQLRGDERVLDVGCGLGLLAIGAAKRLKNGKVVGIDVWSPFDLSGNTADAARANVKLEGVQDKVRIETGDARKLVYPDNHYDVVVSSLVLHNIPERDERAQAVREMVRVLKPGGKLAIFDIFRTGEYAEVLEAAGAKEMTLSKTEFLWCVPGRSLTARK
jgi:ubiquinone/menaquinone biosynthesis C-methylase UbiE